MGHLRPRRGNLSFVETHFFVISAARIQAALTKQIWLLFVYQNFEVSQIEETHMHSDSDRKRENGPVGWQVLKFFMSSFLKAPQDLGCLHPIVTLSRSFGGGLLT